MLPAPELKRRIDAARTLRGMRQEDLARLIHEEGFGKLDVGRVERGSIPLTRPLRRSLAEILEVPEGWFVDEHLDLSRAEPVEDHETGAYDIINAITEHNIIVRGLASEAIADQHKTRDEIIGLLEKIDAAATTADVALQARLQALETQLGELRALLATVGAEVHSQTDASAKPNTGPPRRRQRASKPS